MHEFSYRNDVKDPNKYNAIWRTADRVQWSIAMHVGGPQTFDTAVEAELTAARRLIAVLNSRR